MDNYFDVFRVQYITKKWHLRFTNCHCLNCDFDWTELCSPIRIYFILYYVTSINKLKVIFFPFLPGVKVMHLSYMYMYL